MTKTDWKSKATASSIEKKKVNKRVKEITKSRDQWKEKAIRHKARADKLESDLKKVKDKLIEIVDYQ
jgi:chromosome segregation ATPase